MRTRLPLLSLLALLSVTPAVAEAPAAFVDALTDTSGKIDALTTAGNLTDAYADETFFEYFPAASCVLRQHPDSPWLYTYTCPQRRTLAPLTAEFELSEQKGGATLTLNALHFDGQDMVPVRAAVVPTGTFRGTGRSQLSAEIRQVWTTAGTTYRVSLATTRDACRGQLEGETDYSNGTDLSFIKTPSRGPQESECAVALHFGANGTLTVKTSQCAPYHGVGCAFDGRLTKK